MIIIESLVHFCCFYTDNIDDGCRLVSATKELLCVVFGYQELPHGSAQGELVELRQELYTGYIRSSFSIV
jgi:hypothetical protein